MKWVVVLLSSLVILVAGDQHLSENGPFGKRHTINTEPYPYACNRPNGFSMDVTIADLNVSVTTYSSNEQITVTWTPLSAPCIDDFIGVYFADIPLENGK